WSSDVCSSDRKLHFGLGLYVPFAVASDYESGHAGRYHGLTSEVEVVNLQPTISYKVNDQVSVGAGLVISRIYGKLTSNTNVTPTVEAALPLLGVAGYPDSKVEIEGDDIAYGLNLGVLVDVTERLSWGLTYKSKISYSLEGDTKVSGMPELPASVNHPDMGPIPLPPFQALNTTFDAGVDISLPESIDTSVTYRLDDQWTLYGGATWTRRSRLDALGVKTSGGAAFASDVLYAVEEPLKSQDTGTLAVRA